jgi:ABC-type dipeptide/oligopeptide/nickel transport system ATPase component
MRQRVMIALALSCNPAILIADEPTTALDVTVQAQILDLMNTLKEEYHSAIMLITHNLGVVSQMASHIAVMYLGKVVEYASTSRLVSRSPAPLHQRLAQFGARVRTQGQESSHSHPRYGSHPYPAHPRVCFRRTLPAGNGYLPEPAPRAGRNQARTPGILLAVRRLSGLTLGGSRREKGGASGGD